MNFKSFFIATILSVPLIPLLILESESLSAAVSPKDMLLAVPLVIEFFIIYMISTFLNGKREFTKKEREALLVLAIGSFALFVIPVIVLQLFEPVRGVSTVGLLVLLLYAFINIMRSIHQIISGKQHIDRIFTRNYLYPISASVLLMIIGLIFNVFELNAIALYFIFKNFLSTSKIS